MKPFSCTFSGESLEDVAALARSYADAIQGRVAAEVDARQLPLPIDGGKVAEAKRGRPKKDHIAEINAANAAPVVEKPAAPSLDDMLGGPIAAPVVTKEIVMEELRKLASHAGAKGGGPVEAQGETGMRAVFSVLNQFGAKNVSTIDPKVYADVLKRIKEEMAK